MPAPLLLAGITAGANLLGQGINAASTARQNRLSREWQEKMYGVQRQDALSDWNMLNEYNHPSSQMQRLRDAKLNPNLVYGNGTDVTSGSVRSSSTGNWSPIAPKIDLGDVVSGGIATYYDMQLKEAQTDNIRTQTTVQLQDALLKAAMIGQVEATTGKAKADTDMTKYELGYKQEIQDMSIEALQQSILKTRADTKAMLDENERKAAMQASNLQLAAEAILNYRKGRAKTDAEIAHLNQQIENLKQDNRLKEFDEQLQQQGIPRNSPAWWKVLLNVVGPGLNPFSGDIPGNKGIIPMPFPFK